MMEKLKHYQDQYLAAMRQNGDDVADRIVQQLFLNSDKSLFSRIFSEVQVNKKAVPESLPEYVIQYFEKTSLLPDWANPSKMAEGSAFFSKYSEQILGILGLYSLPYCYAAAHGAQVLVITKRVQEDPGKRFLDTSEFVLDVMAPNAFEGRGRGIRSAQKVRLIHAMVRRYALKSNQYHKEWGLPVNQEDMAGTNLAFSLITIRGLRKSGIEVSPQEAESYMHLWNVIGFILGIDETLLPDTNKEAYLLDKMISKRQFRSSDAGKSLTSSLIDFIKSTAPTTLPSGFVESYMRYFLGNPVADLLSIPNFHYASSAFASFQNINKVNNMLGFNRGSYFKAHSMVKMQRRKLMMK